MEFAFVFASGRMRVDGDPVDAEGAVYRCSLPRGPAMSDDVAVRVAGRDVAIPAVDVLGAVRRLHDDTSWMLSGARAQLEGGRTDAALISDDERAAATARLRDLRDELDWGRVTVEASDDGDWTVRTVDADGGELVAPVTRKSRDAADRAADKAAVDGRMRVLAVRTGLATRRLEELVRVDGDDGDDGDGDGDGSPLTLDEVLRIAAAVDEAPSQVISV